MSDIAERAEDLLRREVVGLLNILDALAGTYRSYDRSNINPCAGDAGLPESNIGIDRNSWVDNHPSVRAQLSMLRS